MTRPATSELFDARYYATGCGQKYERNEDWLAFFGGIADRIIAEIQPRTVLDAGCALGFLVESLRARGVAADGIDISEYAIENTHPSIRPYCRVASIATPLPQRYDLITSIEVVEHMQPEEGRAAIGNLCRYTDDILFSSTPFDYEEATHFNVQTPEFWGEQFAQHGFYRDVDFDASFITEWAVRFRRRQDPLHRIVRDYERRFWLLRKENLDLRKVVLETRAADHAPDEPVRGASERTWAAEELVDTLSQATEELQAQDDALRQWEERWHQLESSPGYGVLRTLQSVRCRVAPPQTSRDHMVDAALQMLRRRDLKTWQTQGGRIRAEVQAQARALALRARRPRNLPATLEILPVTPCPEVRALQASVDVVICVHDALDDVLRCLSAVLEHTQGPVQLILVDDGSDAPTRDFLAEFAAAGQALLLRNETARGYTRAANQGLCHASAEYVVLLNSDTIVGPRWLDRLVACAASDAAIGLVGPLSNAATWQSVPTVMGEEEWAANPLPPGMTVAEMAEAVGRDSLRLYPRLPFLNGFCLLIRRTAMDAIGYFDEENFGAGYGEENDYCLRARQSGWELALADDTYVFHAGSKSYGDERRSALCHRADQALKRKHGERIVQEGVEAIANDRVLAGIRAHAAVLPQKAELYCKARNDFGGRRLLWVLPVMTSGGGGAVVVSKARIMREMGIDVAVFNLPEHHKAFERIYPGLDVPVIYGQPEELGQIGSAYDAVVATANISAYWLLPLASQASNTTLGYFIQDFEPYFYAPDSADYRIAWASYSVIPQMRRFATTPWIQNEVMRNTGMGCGLVGPCYNAGLFRPRPRSLPEWPDRPLRIAAMIRPATPHRAPRLTMEVLRTVEQRVGQDIEIWLFGANADDPAFLALPHDFRWRSAGPLNQHQVAAFMNQVDIFVDFSTFQALGITAQEAMSCGAAVIVPQSGGTAAFAQHGHNCLVVDSSAADSCTAALMSLVKDHALRQRLQRTGMSEVAAYHPVLPAYNILQIVFA